ncbi:MAG: gamma-glutamyltransferase [Chloroflexi bacterium]|nr:gamma-glutamyltransferase [Chloroflexota bacterium]
MVSTTSQPLLSHSVIRSGTGLVTANHRLAAEAGAFILEQGGNAVDAAIATSFAIGVVEPAMSGIGGRGYMLIHAPRTGVSVAIDGHERAPRAATADMFVPTDDRARITAGWGPLTPVEGDANATGHLAVAVPGVVGALAAAHRGHGSLAWETILQPAIVLAAEGFEVTVPLAVLIARHRAKLARFPATAAVFLPSAHAPAPGERLVQSDLAASLRALAERGPAEFYSGAIARAIGAEMARAGGRLCERDLAEFTPREWDQPLHGTYNGHTVLTLPESSGGITLLQILNLLEGYPLAAVDPLGVEYVHLLLESMRVAFADRLAVVDDPACAAVPFAGLASKGFADVRRRAIDRDLAAIDVQPGDAWPYTTDRHTTHFCVVDRDGTVVSMTQSIIDAFGSGVLVPGTGILLNSAMHNFNPVPGRVGSIAPWKRSAHYGTPTIVLRPDGQPVLAIGGAGGTKITTGVAQVVANVVDHGPGLQAAIDAPRVHNEGGPSQVDARFGADVRGRLAGMGHTVEIVESGFAQPGWARINGILFSPPDQFSSGIDPFGDAGAAAPA